MQASENCGKLITKDGWLTCPVCRRNIHMLKIRSDTEARNLQVYCRACRREIVLDIDKGQCVKRQCQ